MTKEQYKEKSTFSIFASYYKPHWKFFAVDMACALVASLADLAFPLVTRYSLQTLLPAKLFSAFFLIMASMILLQAFRGVLLFVVSYVGHSMGVRIEADIRKDLFSHMQELSFGFYDKNRTGQLMNRVTGDLFEITELAHHGPEYLFTSTAVIIGGLIIMFTIQWRLALLITLVFPVAIALTLVLRRRMSRASNKVKERLAGINNQLESSISGMRTAKAFANEDREREKFFHSNEMFKHSKSEFYKAMGMFSGSQEFFMSFINILVIMYGGYLIMQGHFSTIEMITFTLYISAFFTPIRQIISLADQITAGTVGFKRFLQLMRTDPEISDQPGAKNLGRVKGEILFEDVSFSYDGKTPVLSHINLQVPIGETLAVVGPSGGGKSTLCQLIPRFYDVTGGRVLVDGSDVRGVTQKSLRENIGIVQQDVFLFAGSILENIRYGRPEATDQEIVAAARLAEIHEDILSFPDGYDTYVGERGVMLSGGQKQRISIARIFLKNPPILILDEATSALDSITESRIQSAFDKLSSGRTTIVIAHRLSTIRGAQKIVVIEEDGIAEQGSHEELLAKGGEYAKLYRLQNSMF